MTQLTPINIESNRSARKWTRREQLGRVLWALVRPMFSLSPRPLWFWRRFLLKVFGATVGRRTHIYPSVRVAVPWNLSLGEECAIGANVTLYALGRITIGPRSTVSQGAHLCAGTHDICDPSRPLLKLPITLGADVWVAADAFLGPGVTIGTGSIVGARAVVMRDVPARIIVVGNPAKVLRKVDC